MEENYYSNGGIKLKYYEVTNDLQPLVMIHAQGVDGKSYSHVAKQLSKKFHVYSVDCYGHGGSKHDSEDYNIKHIGRAMIDLIENLIKVKVWLLGHSSGGLIAAYIAAETALCEKLILEDPPFFSSQGERRKSTFNYLDLSTICHNYNMQKANADFVLYYFSNQYAWNFFPEKSRNRVKRKLTKIAVAYRQKHPDRDLKVMFWPKTALAGLQGMNNYDPAFGESFYNDSFHCGILHDDILKHIKCQTIFMKATTKISPEGILMAALNEDDTKRVVQLIQHCELVRFNCGHGIHIEQPKKFVKCVFDTLDV